jgi:hypothetical protein
MLFQAKTRKKGEEAGGKGRREKERETEREREREWEGGIERAIKTPQQES